MGVFMMRLFAVSCAIYCVVMVAFLTIPFPRSLGRGLPCGPFDAEGAATSIISKRMIEG
jgi:hypothetical protein